MKFTDIDVNFMSSERSSKILKMLLEIIFDQLW